METNIPLIKAKLENISKRINRLEDQDADYGKNPKWIAMQRMRDKLYAQLKVQEEGNAENADSNNM